MGCRQRKCGHRNPTFGRNTIGRKDIWVQRHLGAKTFGREMRSSALPTIIFYFFQKKFLQKFHIFNGVSVLIFSNFLITKSNKRTN